MSQTASTDQTVKKQVVLKKRPRESDTVETDNPFSPPSDKARVWSKYEKDGQRVAKPPIKRGKSSGSRDASPELLQSPPAPSDSAAPSPAPPKKPAAAAARIKAANKPGLKEGILNPFSARALREKAKEQRKLEQAQKLREQERLESEKQVQECDSRLALLEQSLVKPLPEHLAESSVSPEKTRDKYLEVTSEYLHIDTTPSREVQVISGQSEDGARAHPIDPIFDPTHTYPVSEATSSRPASPVVGPPATHTQLPTSFQPAPYFLPSWAAQPPPAWVSEQLQSFATRESDYPLEVYAPIFDKSLQEHYQPDEGDVPFTTLQEPEAEQSSTQADLLVHRAQGVPPVPEGDRQPPLPQIRSRRDPSGSVERRLWRDNPEREDSDEYASASENADDNLDETRGAGSASRPADFAYGTDPVPSPIQRVSEVNPVSDREIPPPDYTTPTSSPAQSAPLLDPEPRLGGSVSLLPSLPAGGESGRLLVEAEPRPIREPNVFPVVPGALQTDRGIFDPRVLAKYFGSQFSPEQRGSPQAAHATVGPTTSTMAATDGAGGVPPEKPDEEQVKQEGETGSASIGANVKGPLEADIRPEPSLEECQEQLEKYAQLMGDTCANNYDLENQDTSEAAQLPLVKLFALANTAMVTDEQYWQNLKEVNKWPGKGKSPQDKLEFIPWIQNRINEQLDVVIQSLLAKTEAKPGKTLEDQKADIVLFANRKFYRQVTTEVKSLIERNRLLRELKVVEGNLADERAKKAKDEREFSILRNQLEAITAVTDIDNKVSVKQEQLPPSAFYVAKPSDHHDAYIHGQGRAPAMVEGKLPNTELNWIVSIASTHPGVFDFETKPGYRFEDTDKTGILNLPAQDSRCQIPLPNFPKSVEVFYDFNITAVRSRVTEVGGQSQHGIYTHIEDKYHPHLRVYWYACQGVSTSKHNLLVVLVNTQATNAKGSPDLLKLRGAVLRHRSEFMELVPALQEMQNMAREIWADPRNSPRLSKKDLEKLARKVHRVNELIGRCVVLAKGFGLHVMPSSRAITTHFAMTHMIQFEQAIQEVMNKMGERGVPASELEKLYKWGNQPSSPSAIPRALDNVFPEQRTFTTTEGQTPIQDTPLVIDPRIFSDQGAQQFSKNEYFGDLKLLPRQDLPVFSGRKQDYKRWKNRWMNQVGRDFRLPVSKRMHYLKESIRKNCQHIYKIAEYELEDDEEGYNNLWDRLDTEYDKKGREMVLLWKTELERMQPLSTKNILYSDQVKAAEWFESRLNRILKEYQEARNQAGYDPILVWASLEPKIRHPFKLPWDTHVAIKRGLDPDFMERDQVREFRHWLSKVLLPDLRKKRDLELIDRAARGGHQEGGNGSGSGGGGGAGHKGGGGKKGGGNGGGGSGSNNKGGGNGGGNRVGNQIAYTTNTNTGATTSPPVNGGGGLTHQSQVNMTKGQARNKNKPNRVNSKCILCGQAHSVVDCDASLNPEGIFDKFYASDTCTCCGLIGHHYGICTFKGSKCRKCDQRHVTALHGATFNPFTTWRQKNPDLAAKIEELRKKAAAALKPKGAKGQGKKSKTTAQQGKEVKTPKPKGSTAKGGKKGKKGSQ